jgi:hypothetical protein
MRAVSVQNNLKQIIIIIANKIFTYRDETVLTSRNYYYLFYVDKLSEKFLESAMMTLLPHRTLTEKYGYEGAACQPSAAG